MRLALLLLAACTAAPPVARAALEAPVVYPPRGSTQLIYKHGESCRWNGPNPIVLRPRTEPRVGTELQVAWQLSAAQPPPGTPAVAVLLSFSPLDNPVGFGAIAPGCWLLVNPEHILIPAADGWLRYDTTVGIVTMQFTPVPGIEGVSLYTQLIVAMPQANQLGYICSLGLQINIGVAHP